MNTQAQVNIFGLLAAAGAGVAFSVIDMIFKFLSGDYPLYEIVLFRSVVAMIVMLAVIVSAGGRLPSFAHPSAETASAALLRGAVCQPLLLHRACHPAAG